MKISIIIDGVDLSKDDSECSILQSVLDTLQKAVTETNEGGGCAMGFDLNNQVPLFTDDEPHTGFIKINEVNNA